MTTDQINKGKTGFLDYFALHWKGALPIKITFFVNCVVGFILLRFVASVVYSNLNWDQGLVDQLGISWMLTITLLYLVWALVGFGTKLLTTSEWWTPFGWIFIVVMSIMNLVPIYRLLS